MIKNIIICLLFATSAIGQQLSFQEKSMYVKMNIQRLIHGKSWLPLNKDLNKVARLHLENLKDSLRRKDNPHKWYADPQNRWTACDFKGGYGCDGKAQEITGYAGEDSEIYCDQNKCGSRTNVKEWMRSKGHRNTILEQGCYSDTKWKSCGVSIYDDRAVIWFGTK